MPTPGKPTKKKRAVTPDYWGLELHTERKGLFFYRYRRIRFERTGRRAAVREFTFQLDLDVEGKPITRPRQLVRQRGRSLSAAECDQLWRAIRKLHPERLSDTYPCLDDVDPELLDPSRWAEGHAPISVACGEEGPACLTLRTGRPKDASLTRVVIDRYSAPSPLCADALKSSKAPLASIIALIDPGLRDTQAFTYRQSRPLDDLTAEFRSLKARDFLNLKEFEAHCLEALGSLGDARVIPFLSGELFAPDPRVRLQAINALANIGDGAAARHVELLYYDDDPEVRSRARQILEHVRHRV